MDKDITILINATIKEALKKLNESAVSVLAVIDNQNKLVGTISDGDIRRHILNGKDISSLVHEACNIKHLFLKQKEYSINAAKSILISKKIKLLPIVDDKNKVVDYITWEQAFAEQEEIINRYKKLNVPVVIQAGGKGARLDPFTRILPKPLIPIGDKAMLELIIDQFMKFGINNYSIIVNYKGEMIKAYFDSIDKDYKIKYFWEKHYCGTAGGIKLVTRSVGNTFIVTNCDIIVSTDYYDLIKFHHKNKSDLTIVSSIRNHKIPYGVVEFSQGGRVINLFEKPEQTHSIITGVYVLEKNCLKYIKSGQSIDMPELIDKLLHAQKRVFTYPVSDSDYTDIGQWEEYKKAIQDLSLGS